MQGNARRLLRGLVVALAMCVPANGAMAATPPAGFFGLGNWSIPTAGQSSQLGQAGLHSYRTGLPWDLVEHVQGTRNWYYIDNFMTQAARDGYDVTLDFNGCTAWACGATRAAPAPGAQQDAFENFVAAAVARYGANGSFWTAHPELTRRTVSWQVWNEVNAGADWPDPTPAAYAQLLALTSKTIKEVDPTAVVVMSGLTELPANRSGRTLTQFLTGLYQQPGFAQSFDVAAVHGYAASPTGVIHILDTAHTIMAANGDKDKPLWITEMGWASGGPSRAFTTGPAGQATDLSTSFDQLLACRSRWNLGRVIWFSIDDADPGAQGSADYWGYHTGLFNTDHAPKPAYRAFTQYLTGQPLPDGRADTCTLPRTKKTVRSARSIVDRTWPKSRIWYHHVSPTGLASLRIVGKGASGIAGYRCRVDSHPWKRCTTRLTLALRRGRHVIQVRARDRAGHLQRRATRLVLRVAARA